jgi:hypothetical protein
MKGDNLHGEGDESRSVPIRPAAATFGLGSTSKIRDVHVNRLALVYVRQSTPQQVLENRESRERQYALAEFAQRLGWPAERVVVIDEDQGQSGKTAAERSGFQRLMTEASLNHVGVVLGLELSRLSRSNKDWHQLIDVCGIFNTLLCDQDAVYDPLDSNDRLLLGMRGAMSEYGDPGLWQHEGLNFDDTLRLLARVARGVELAIHELTWQWFWPRNRGRG